MSKKSLPGVWNRPARPPAEAPWSAGSTPAATGASLGMPTPQRTPAVQRSSERGIGKGVLTLAALGALGAGIAAYLPDLTRLGIAQMSACPTGSRSMTRLELLFGLTRRLGPPITDTEWQAFVDAEIAPRFPAGLTILSGDGQWRSSGGVTIRQPSKVVLVWHVRGPEAEARVEAVRRAYKARFAQESVMRVDAESCVSF